MSANPAANENLLKFRSPGEEFSDHLRERWFDQRADDPMPLALELFLSDWYELLPNLLLIRLDGKAVNAEYLGAIAKQYFRANILDDICVKDGINTATRTRLPCEVITGKWRSVFLPFADEQGAVYVILAGFTDR